MIINKLGKKTIVIISLLLIYAVASGVYARLVFFQQNIETKDKSKGNISEKQINNIFFQTSKQIVDEVTYNNTVGKIVWDGLTMGELTDKLNRMLNSTLAGKGEIFATHSLELGMDPYLAVAIVLQETGCQWNCSYLVNACNNVGGQKGSPGCDGGSYKAYSTLDEGIIGYLDNLYYNYYAYGLTTAEAMNPKYAESTAWAYNVNSYIEKIKAA
ncbi:MAG: glucosaminidase domain-containing protein [Bacilli bacterium]|nr:glucosaminidase domain-containing protein [Bacilli bacterium]MCI9434807.1 glucosaminidase domain-containing protein [Bacilli bacterium]